MILLEGVKFDEKNAMINFVESLRNIQGAQIKCFHHQ